MCVGTTIKRVSFVASILAILASIGTGIAFFGGWISNKALADYRINILWSDKTENTQEHTDLQGKINTLTDSVDTRLTKIETNTEWIIKKLDKMKE